MNVQSFLLFRHYYTVSSSSPTSMHFTHCNVVNSSLLPSLKRKLQYFGRSKIKRIPSGIRMTET